MSLTCLNVLYLLYFDVLPSLNLFFLFFFQLVCVIEYADADSQQQAMEILHTNSPYRVVTAEHAINEGAVSSFLKEKISMVGSGAAPPLLRPQVCTRVLVLHNIVTPQDVSGCIQCSNRINHLYCLKVNAKQG